MGDKIHKGKGGSLESKKKGETLNLSLLQAAAPSPFIRFPFFSPANLSPNTAAPPSTPEPHFLLPFPSAGSLSTAPHYLLLPFTDSHHPPSLSSLRPITSQPPCTQLLPHPHRPGHILLSQPTYRPPSPGQRTDPTTAAPSSAVSQQPTNGSAR